MDVGTIAIPFVVLGALALFLVLVRRLPPAEDDVAAVVASVLGTPAELERPPADIEEPVRWRVDLLLPPAARQWHGVDRSRGLTSQDRSPRPRVSRGDRRRGHAASTPT